VAAVNITDFFRVNGILFFYLMTNTTGDWLKNVCRWSS